MLSEDFKKGWDMYLAGEPEPKGKISNPDINFGYACAKLADEGGAISGYDSEPE